MPLPPDATKWCSYCGYPHANRGRACSPGCERRIRAHKASVTMGRNRALKRIMARVRKREQHRGKWRNVVAGRDVPGNLRLIFGVDVPTDPGPYVGFSGSDEP